MWSLDYEKILKKTDDFLQKQQSSIEFKNIIFQIAYFDKIKYEQYIKKYHQNIIEDKNKEIQSTKDALKNKENEIEKNRQQLHAQEQQIKEQEQKLLEIEEENKKLKDKLKDLLAEKNINYNDPKSNK
jgi:chromosome segregation ATPase